MPLTRRRTSHLTLLLAAVLLAATPLAMGAEAAKAATDAPPKPSGYHARVARGGTVDLAASTLTDAQLAALRPHYESLKPRARGNTD